MSAPDVSDFNRVQEECTRDGVHIQELKKHRNGLKLGFRKRPNELSPLLNWFVHLFRGADSGLWEHRLSMR